MKIRKFCITISAGVALLASFPLLAAAGERAAGGDRLSSPLLSRFWPGLSGQGNILTGSPALATRFQLGYFTTGPAAAVDDELSLASSYLSQSPVRQSTTSIATLGYDSYYGATRLDLSSFASPTGAYTSGMARKGENLGLSLEAGIRHDDLNAGVLYAYRSNYTRQDNAPAGTPYPMYIFTPSVGGLDLDGRGHEGHAVFLYLGYNLSRQLNVRGTLGLAKTSARPGEEKSLRFGEQSRRWGVDFAATYKLLDNLVYEAHLGYVSIDDSSPAPAPASQLSGGSDGAPLSGSAPAALYHIGSHIRMTF